MPGKHVRFEGIPPTPSPLYSYTTSLPSDDGPSTPPPPPPLSYIGSPYARTPLPSAPNQLNSVLDVARIPRVHYDLTLPSESLKLHPSLAPQVLDEPAVYPPLPYMTIVCNKLPWPINVTASNSKHGTYVSVRDVFHAVYRALRLNVDAAEFNAIPRREDMQKVSDAYHRRYSGLVMDRKALESEKSKGIKRVDFLQETHMFGGFRRASGGSEVWELCVL